MLGFTKVETMKALRATLLSLMALTASAGVAFAQETPAVGVMGGINQSYYATSPSGETDAQTGYIFGAFAVFFRDSYFKLQPEFQVSQRKVGVEFAGVDTTYDTTYVNAGLLLRLKLYKSLYSTQGVQFGFPTRSKLTVPGGTADNKENIKSDVSLVIGVGQQFGRIGIEGRWDSGMKTVEEIPLGGFVKRNRAITFVGIVGF